MIEHTIQITDMLKEAVSDAMDADEYFVIIGNGDKVIVMSEGLPTEDIIQYSSRAVWEASKEWDKDE